MRPFHLSIAIFAILLALTAVVFAQPSQYDLENFEDLSAGAAAGAGVLVGLKVGSVNPTLGSEGLIAFEFTTKSELTVAFSILNILPGFKATPRLLARITTIVAGGAGREGAWIGGAALLGSSIDSDYSPTSDKLKLFIPVQFTIAAGVTVRIEITGAQAPLLFSFLSDVCRTAIALLPPTNLLIKDKDCCSSFEAYLVAGVGAGIALPPLGLQLGSSFVVYAKVSAEICPNYGSDHEDCEPEQCSHPPSSWHPITRKVCCQYANHRDKPECDKVICIQDEKLGRPFDPKRCCQVKGLSELHHECTLCDPGNFPVEICCDGFNNATRQFWRENDTRCDPVVCWCEEWDNPRCCYQHLGSPYYNTTKCPPCEIFWDSERCCQYPEWSCDPKCLCQDNEDYLSPWCCQSRETFIPERCENPCEAPCGCEEESLTCPCAVLGGCNGDDSTGNSYVRYTSHDLTAENITSGHNTVLINHLHIQVDGSDNASDLQTLISLSLQSGGGDSLLTQIRDQIRDDVNTIVGDVKGKLDHLNDTLSGIVDPIKGILDETIGKPVRQILRILRKGPLNALELTTMRILYNTQLMLQAKSTKYNIRWTNQYKFGAGASVRAPDGTSAAAAGEGNVLVADISEPDTSQDKMSTILNAASSKIITNTAKAFGADVSIDSTLAVSGSNECPANSCSASCQCEAFYACTDDSECLSGKCDTKKLVCSDGSSTSSALFRHYSSVFLAMLFIIASVAIFRQNH